MFMNQHQDHRGIALWGLVLAAGDGKRLQSYVQQLKGKELPKQFVNFVGQRSMLEHTFQRAEKLIRSEQIYTIVSRHHLAHPEVRRQLSDRLEETVVVQPENRETGPGILLPLMFLFKQCPDAIVALFPSDHFVLEEDRFMGYVGCATEAVRHDPSRIVLIAMEAREPETEYGYIFPGEPISGLAPFGIRSVSRFIEKPTVDLALALMLCGGLWNTMTMVFEVKTLLNLVRRVAPILYLKFCKILAAIGTPAEDQAIEAVYDSLTPVNFSKGIMEKIADQYPESVAVLPVQQVHWTDWGSPQRLNQALRTLERAETRQTLVEANPKVAWPYENRATSRRVRAVQQQRVA
jgi:mannose-1-phosphate guanylyltransferase